jgi:hypothetical protein
MQPAAGIRGEADDIAGVRRNFGFNQHDFKHIT